LTAHKQKDTGKKTSVRVNAKILNSMRETLSKKKPKKKTREKETP